MTGILSLLVCLSLWPRSLAAQSLAAARVNRDAPTARGLVGWWRAVPGTTGGTRLYDLLGREAITLVNTTSRASTERPGGAGYATFNGTNAYGATAVSPRFFPATQTLMLWMKRTAVGDSYQTLIGGATGVDRQLYVRSSGALAFSNNFSGGFYSADFTGPTLAVNTWYHVAMQHSATGGFMSHVNCAVQQAYAPDGTTFAAVTRGVGIGAEEGGTLGFFSGLIDDVRIYDRAVPQAELCTIMRESSRGEPTLLRPPLLAFGFAPELAPSGARGNFFRFFGQP
jgi:Concanavalin A-like lectin/glucanases superfamily